MLNKNRMMVFKNKGKDQEVSESSLLSDGEITEFLVRWKLSVGESRRSHIRHPARCHFPPPELVHAFICLNCFPPAFSLSLFLLYLFLPLIILSFLCFILFFFLISIYIFHCHFIPSLSFLFLTFYFFFLNLPLVFSLVLLLLLL